MQLEFDHDLEIEGTIEASIAGSRSGLFSGQPGEELRLTSFDFTSAAPQSRELTSEEIQLLASFPPQFFLSYRGNAVGTGSSPGGRTRLGRFTPTQMLEARMQLVSLVRVGG